MSSQPFYDTGTQGSFQFTGPGMAHGVTPRRRLRRVLLTGIAVTLFTLCALFLAVIVLESAGLTAATLGLLTATTVLGIVIPVLLWVDRLEAEPARIMWFAFLWGALVSTAGAIVLNEFGMAFFAGLAVDPQFAGPVFVAPIIEEALKCLGVLMIFIFARREFNGIVDGIVYAGMVAVGFAFIENIIYLAGAFLDGGAPGLVGLFILRCLMSPFAHPMFTIAFGITLGLLTHRRRWSLAWLPVLGYVLAVFLHFLWNYAAVSSTDGWLLLYAVIQVPMFVGFVVLLGFARHRETVMLREHLTGYGLNGWFTPAEVAMLTTPRERRRARQWARGVGGARAEEAMESFQDEAVELAIARDHLHRGDPDPIWSARERTLLQTVQFRRAVFSPSVPTPPPGAVPGSVALPAPQPWQAGAPAPQHAGATGAQLPYVPHKR